MAIARNMMGLVDDLPPQVTRYGRQVSSWLCQPPLSHRPDHLHPNEQPERADLSPPQKHVLDTQLIWCALAIASQAKDGYDTFISMTL